MLQRTIAGALINWEIFAAIFGIEGSNLPNVRRTLRRPRLAKATQGWNASVKNRTGRVAGKITVRISP